jgi:LSD1 subclass zinc finger protein
MPIQVTCPTCGKLLQAPDSTAGKRVRCPSCQTIVDVPGGLLEAEAVGPPGGFQDYSPPAPVGRPHIPAEAEAGDERRPCPMCGEMIPARASKCRFCGEVFDPALRRLEKRKQTAAEDSNLTAGDWVLAVLCSDIACILGIIRLIMGKPSGGKLIGASLIFIAIRVVIVLVMQAGQQGGRF